MLLFALALLSSPNWSCQDPRLQLPPSAAPQSRVAAVPEPRNDVERFRRDLLRMHTAGGKAEAVLQEIGQSYRNVGALVIAAARKATPRELQDLVLVARRYNGPEQGPDKVADEFLFQALTRPLGEATRPVLEAMLELSSGDDRGRTALAQLLRGRIAAARFHAGALLAKLFAAADPAQAQRDFELAQQISSDPDLDLQLAGVQLLAAVPLPAARERLVQLLAKDPTVAGAACQALGRLGADAVAPLQQAIAAPVVDRAFGYAAFALATVGEALRELQLPAELHDKLQQQLQSRDLLLRCLCAVPLADLRYHSTAAVDDGDVVEALLAAVEPQRFVANIDLLRRAAEQRLQRLTGRYAGGGLGWREWWREAGADFVGVRAEVPVDEASCAELLLTVRSETSRVRLLGERLAAVDAIKGATEVVLTPPQMLELVQTLQRDGLRAATAAVYGDGLPLPRSLELRVGRCRTLVAAPAQEAPLFDALLARIDAVVQREVWQLLRDPATPRAAFWRQQRDWLDAHQEPGERLQRLVGLAVGRWPQLDDRNKARVLDRLFARGERRPQLQPADGAAIVAMVRGLPALAEPELRLLEAAVLTPEASVWRDAIDVAASLPGGGQQQVSRLFALLGADAVLAALDDARPVVRCAAIDEVVRMQDLRAAPRLLQLLHETDERVQRSAVFACGMLQVDAASAPLRAMVAAAATAPALRREALRSIGRIGGPGAFELLEQELGAAEIEDRQAALRGLGELRERRSAQLLAQLFAAAPQTEVGDLARFYLQRLGASLAQPALRAQLSVQDPATRREIVDLLAGYQDPQVVPDLIEQIRQGDQPLRTLANLEGITGLDITSVEDRVGELERWYQKHRQEAQWQWLLQALQRDQVATTLAAAQFEPEAGNMPVPELARLLVDAPSQRLRCLCAAVLRDVTGEDYGAVNAMTPPHVLATIAARYRALFDSSRAAQRR